PSRWWGWVASVGRRVPRQGRDGGLGWELSQGVLLASLDASVPDGTEAVRRGGHELRGLHGLLEGLRLLEGQGARFHLRIEPRGRAHFLRDPRGDASELFPEERGALVRLRLLHHLPEASELNSVRVRRDFAGLRWKVLGCPVVDGDFAIRR